MDDVLGVDVGAAVGDLGEQWEYQRQTWGLGGLVKVVLGVDCRQERTAVTVLLNGHKDRWAH